ncbi:hypothetical protein [Flavobacterium sp. 90]|uniref:hypothetical protein n=2 Tax=unclassified Flavobacterium TaxID=196869 RepID=UPI001049C7C1|nr:hypothetical protein [Flavobacterium sp. 90]
MEESLLQEVAKQNLLLSDQEIGFDAARETLFLKKRGLNTSEDLNLEIDRVREMYKAQYIQMKSTEEELLQKTQPKRLLKAGVLTDVSQSEKEALKALYDSTNGSKWTNKTGWDFSTPVTSWNNTTKTGWFGITVTNGQITSLNLGTNNLNGFIPPEIGQLKYLKFLSIRDNKLSGTIPEEIGKLIDVEILALDANKLSGNLPKGIYDLKSLIYIYVNNNLLSGTISPEIKKLTNLTYIYSSINQFSGSIPAEIGQLSKLIFIDFRSNELTGPIPPEIGQLKNLTSLYLQYNKLTGTIPPQIGLLTKVQWMNLSYNQLNGNIPIEIEKIAFNYLYLNDNLLEGALPNLRASYLLDIRNNKFCFTDMLNRIALYKTKTNHSPQAKTDTAKTITSAIGGSVTLTMCEDGRFLPDDTFQWFKNNIEIVGATNRIYTITDLKNNDTGVYSCKSYHINNPDMSPLVLEREPITLNTINCSPLIGAVKSPSEKFYTNLESNFTFETIATNLTYVWSVTSVTGENVNTQNSDMKNRMCSYKFTAEGDYLITLTATDTTGCSTTFTKTVKIIDKHCIKEDIQFSFETTVTNLNYTWSATNTANVIVNTTTNNTGQYTFTPEVPGEYEIKLSAEGAQNCETLFSKKISVENCIPFASCTASNPNTPIIKSLFVALVNKVLSQPESKIKDGYTCPELMALKPYIKNENPAIYNFKNRETFLEFSFTNRSGLDVVMEIKNGKIVDFNLDNYVSPETETKLIANHLYAYIKGVDFCPSELSCVSHVALVVDESGSIDLIAANKIKKQLKSFILQQATTNDNIGSNIYVSITGMSDSDENTRTDFIRPTKLTNTPAVINQFNTWIDNYGNRGGKTTGVSASSDYWRSGLEGALSYSMKPNLVLMITDGCQTADVLGLKTTLKKFNNAHASNSQLPHLYVVGLEKGFYVDENFYTNKNSGTDPNTGTLVNTVTTHLTKSLQYLLDLPATQFPKSDSNQFDKGTYYGHENFNLLASDDTYFSDKLADSKIVCGTASVKDFCDDCLSFKPEPGKEYLISAWVKEELFTQVKTYENPSIKIIFYNRKEALDIPAHKIDSLSIKASGAIIEGWQRIVKKFKIPSNTITIGIQLENASPSIPVYFDDIRIHPLQGSVKSFVYDPETFKLMSELDENNYSTFYEYDNEGGLVRVKKETEKGIKTIQETRSGSVINTN